MEKERRREEGKAGEGESSSFARGRKRKVGAYGSLIQAKHCSE